MMQRRGLSLGDQRSPEHQTQPVPSSGTASPLALHKAQESRPEPTATPTGHATAASGGAVPHTLFLEASAEHTMLEDMLIRPDGVFDEAPFTDAGEISRERESSEAAGTGCEDWGEGRGQGGGGMREAAGKLAESASGAAARAGWEFGMLQEAAMMSDGEVASSVDTLEGVSSWYPPHCSLKMHAIDRNTSWPASIWNTQ